VDGFIVGIRGHEHDGGSGVSVSINGKTICSSVPTYAKVEGKGATEETHFTIAQFSLCNDNVKISKGDKLIVKADFDTEKHPQRQSNLGDMEHVVAIAIITMALPSEGLPVGYEPS